MCVCVCVCVFIGHIFFDLVAYDKFNKYSTSAENLFNFIQRNRFLIDIIKDLFIQPLYMEIKEFFVLGIIQFINQRTFYYNNNSIYKLSFKFRFLC